MAELCVQPNLLEKTVKRLIFVLDLLVKADGEGDFKTASACMDVYNWQMKETYSNTENGSSSQSNATIPPFEYNFWTTLARGSRDDRALYLDRLARGAVVNYWYCYRYRADRGKKVEYTLKTISIAGAAADCGNAARNKALNTDISEEELKENTYYKDRRKPVISMTKPPSSVIKNLKIDEKEVIVYKTIGCPKEFLERSRKILLTASFKHQSGAREYLEQYKDTLDKWVEDIFEYYHSKKGCEKLNILTMPTLDYSSVKKVILDHNVFKVLDSVCKRPEGPYPEVKESDYFVTKFLLWKMSQGLYEIQRRVNWKVDVENKLLLHLTIMQIFCILCEQGRSVHKHLVLVQNLRASTDKVKFVLSLNPVQKAMLNTYNMVTLHMYRKPHIGIVDRMDSVDIGEDLGFIAKEESEKDKKGEATGGVQKRVESEIKKNNPDIIVVQREDGFFEYKDGGEVLKDIYEKTEEAVKEMDCSNFKKCYRRVTEEEEKDFDEIINRFRPLGPAIVEDAVFSGNRSEDFTEGLKNILDHYLRPSEESK